MTSSCRSTGRGLGGWERWTTQNPRHALWANVKDRVAGACSSCATAFGASEAIEGAGVALVDAFEGHPSVRGYLEDGDRVVTYGPGRFA